MNEQLAAAGAAAALCALAGLFVPALIRAVPEPEPGPEPAEDEAEQPAEEPKIPYAEVAAAAGLAWKSALAAAAAGAVVGWSIGWDWPLLILLPLVPVGVALAVIDWRTRLLPTRVVLPTLAVTAALAGVCWVDHPGHRRDRPRGDRDAGAPLRLLAAVVDPCRGHGLR